MYDDDDDDDEGISTSIYITPQSGHILVRPMQHSFHLQSMLPVCKAYIYSNFPLT